MTPDDPISAALDPIRDRIRKAEDAGMSRDLDGVIYTHGLMTGTSRRLLGALEAVLAEHCQAVSEPGWCQECGFTWPCSTVEAITRALTGEGKTGG